MEDMGEDMGEDMRERERGGGNDGEKEQSIWERI